MKTFSVEDRQLNIRALGKEKFDLFIIGGGITGAGVARDAALRGMKVGLIEASDFASGTSSRSSKLIHGGIRYLENMEFKLVFEALTERQKLFQMAPHLVHPLRFMIPLYEQSRVGMFKMGLGMWAYDALSLFQAPEMHERLTPAETKARMPSLQSHQLLGSYVYSDAYMDDDRLTLETLRSANSAGAMCANYVKAVGAEFSAEGKMKKVLCEDQISKDKFTVEARHFVSTVGPWTDEVGTSLFKEWKKILRPTKGVHLTFEKKRLPLGSAVVMGAEKRIVFGIPRHEMVIVGTTDTDFQGNPSDVVAGPDDVEYLLGVIENYFPGAKIQSSDILASYAGVRPLVNDGSSTEGKTSREHIIFTESHGVTFVAGGKYTTYRLMAEQIITECLRFFPLEDRVRFNRCTTEQPINPLITEESRQQDHLLLDQLNKIGHLPLQDAARFVDRHGAEARKIWQNFGPATYWELEAWHALENTMCLHLVDFYTRRAPLFLAEPDHGFSAIGKIASVFTRYLGWNRDQLEAEERNLALHMKRELAWRQKIS
jgi:glycerol-3-phosphate dehydrogenase